MRDGRIDEQIDREFFLEGQQRHKQLVDTLFGML